MTYFDVQRYELHSSTVRIKAENKAEAIIKVLNGEGTEIDGSQVYIEPAEEYGTTAGDHLTADECRALVKAKVISDDDDDEDMLLIEQIPAIRDITESDDQTDWDDE